MRCYIDAVERWLIVFVTEKEFVSGVVLGRDAWRPISVWALQTQYSEGLTKASILKESLLQLHPVEPQMSDADTAVEALLDMGRLVA